MFRGARRDVELQGQVIPAGSFVLAMIGAANRDPRVFPEPDHCVPGRAGQHLAFGHGIHFCLGAPLARLEARIALPDLLALPPMELADEAWMPRAAFHVHGPARLPLRVSLRRA